MAEMRATDRDPWQRWDVLTTPMTQTEAREVANFIDTNLNGVTSVVMRPGETLRLVWHRESVEMFVSALLALQTTGSKVPQGILDNLEHWLEHLADAAEDV